jgi:hypothetical protein
MWKEFNNNPCGRRVGDCAVRAVSVALGIDWEDAYEMLTRAGYWMCDMPSSDSVIGAVLRGAGYNRYAVDNSCPDCYTAEEFCHANPQGTFVLFTGGHVVTAIDGCLYDSWDSSRAPVIYYWTK